MITRIIPHLTRRKKCTAVRNTEIVFNSHEVFDRYFLSSLNTVSSTVNLSSFEVCMLLLRSFPISFSICGYLLRTPNNSRDQHCFIVHWKNYQRLKFFVGHWQFTGTDEFWPLTWFRSSERGLSFFLPVNRFVPVHILVLCLFLVNFMCKSVHVRFFFFFLCFYIVLYFCLHDTTYSIIFLINL